MASEEIDIENIPKLKVADLKVLLKERDLPITGNKGELVERLIEAVEKEADTLDTSAGDLIDPSVEEDILNIQDEEEEVDPPAKEIEETTHTTEPPKDNVKQPEPVKVSTKSTGLVTKADSDKLLERSERFGIGQQADEVKKLDRLKRFGATSEEAKKLARAERFGIAFSTNTADSAAKKTGAPKIQSSVSADVDVLKKRAERFGVISSVMTKVDENERLLKRKQRFGAVTAAQEVDEKKKKRAERFGLTS